MKTYQALILGAVVLFLIGLASVSASMAGSRPNVRDSATIRAGAWC